jgi:hypothetical protein
MRPVQDAAAVARKRGNKNEDQLTENGKDSKQAG